MYYLRKQKQESEQPSASVYATPLKVELVTYFGRALRKTRRIKPPKGGEVCHHQHWKIVLVLVNFQEDKVHRVDSEVCRVCKLCAW